jgi:hypothetical protein
MRCNMVRFELPPGQRFDTVGVAPLIKDIDFGGLIADKALDSERILEDPDASSVGQADSVLSSMIAFLPQPRRVGARRRGAPAPGPACRSDRPSRRGFSRPRPTRAPARSRSGNPSAAAAGGS